MVCKWIIFSVWPNTLRLHFRYIHRYSRNQSTATTVIPIPTSERTATNFLKKIVLLRLVTPLEIGAKSHMNWHCAPPLPKSNQQVTTSIDCTQSCLIPTTARTATKFLEQYRVTEIGHTNGKWSDTFYDLTLCASASDAYSVVRDINWSKQELTDSDNRMNRKQILIQKLRHGWSANLSEEHGENRTWSEAGVTANRGNSDTGLERGGAAGGQQHIIGRCTVHATIRVAGSSAKAPHGSGRHHAGRGWRHCRCCTPLQVHLPASQIKTVILNWRCSFTNDLEPLTEAFRNIQITREIFGASELQFRSVSQGAGAPDRHGRHGRSAPTPRWWPGDRVSRWGPFTQAREN